MSVVRLEGDVPGQAIQAVWLSLTQSEAVRLRDVLDGMLGEDADGERDWRTRTSLATMALQSLPSDGITPQRTRCVRTVNSREQPSDWHPLPLGIDVSRPHRMTVPNDGGRRTPVAPDRHVFARDPIRTTWQDRIGGNELNDNGRVQEEQLLGGSRTRARWCG